MSAKGSKTENASQTGITNLFDDYPTRTVGYEDHLPTVAVLPVRSKEIINIVKEIPAPAENIQLSRNEMPIRNARPETPGKYPSIATQIRKQVSRPKRPKVTRLIRVPLLIPHRPSVKRWLRLLQRALPACRSARMSTGASSRGPHRPRGGDVVRQAARAVRKVVRPRAEWRPEDT